IKFNFPDTWRLEPQAQGLMIVNQVSDASFALSTKRYRQGDTPESFARDRELLNVREGRSITIAGMPAYLGIADKAITPYGKKPVRFAVIFENRRSMLRRNGPIAYFLRGAGKYDLRKIANDGAFISTIFSFGEMNTAELKTATVPTLQIVRAEEDTTMEKLAAESPITNYALDKLRVMNGLYPSGQPAPGQLIKIVD
ncbi:MAG: hypothetical protein AAF512_26570, partial [Pseudomonadota bacterium]